MTAHLSPTFVLLVAFCSTALIAAAIYLLQATKVKSKRVNRKIEIKDGSATLRKEGFYKNDGVYDANEFRDDQEELEVMSYPTRIRKSDLGHLPIDEPAPIAPSSLCERRNKSPEDNPDTQDLWLDVRKIAQINSKGTYKFPYSQFMRARFGEGSSLSSFGGKFLEFTLAFLNFSSSALIARNAAWSIPFLSVTSSSNWTQMEAKLSMSPISKTVGQSASVFENCPPKKTQDLAMFSAGYCMQREV